MNRANRYSGELRERAMRMVGEHRGEYRSGWAAIVSIATKLGMTPEMLRQWLRRDEVDGGRRIGVTSEERGRLRQLERENRELRRANEILRAAAAFSRPTSTRDRRSRDLHRRPQRLLGDRADLSDVAGRSLDV